MSAELKNIKSSIKGLEIKGTSLVDVYPLTFLSIRKAARDTR